MSRVLAAADGGLRRAMADDKQTHPALVDPRVVSELRALLGDDVDDLIDTYLTYAPKLLAEMTAASGRGDAAAVATQAHALKGSGGNLGVVALSGGCAELELAAREGALAELPARIAQLSDLYARTAVILRELRGQAR